MPKLLDIPSAAKPVHRKKVDVYDENGEAVDDKIVSFVGIAPMDDPQYIVLVALDTPSAETGYYISGGVMAAPHGSGRSGGYPALFWACPVIIPAWT